MKRRKFIYQTSMGLGGLLPIVNSLNAMNVQEGPYFSTGIKIGELTSNEAIIWVRLTKNLQPVGKEAPVPTVLYLDEKNGEWHPTAYFKKTYKQDRPDREVQVNYPKGYTVDTIEGAVPGISGDYKISYKPINSTNWKTTKWLSVNEHADFTNQIKLENLTPATQYEIKIEAKSKTSNNIASSITGSFKTAGKATDTKDVHFMVTTCHEYADVDDPTGGGFKIYKHMQALKPDFMVHTGDVIYYDSMAKELSLAYWHWQRMFGLRNAIDFYKQTPTYFMKDDHDTWMNDCYPGETTRFMGKFTFKQGVETFKQQVPMSEKPYRTFRWGKDLQIWVVEGREYRDKNNIPDGPEKTIWGKVQMEWFKNSFEASDATYKILISPTPIVGPDRPQKRDNHANSGFAYEGAQIKNFLSGRKNVFVICGDRHWQYVSQDLKTKLMEFSCGPASNEHAGGWKKEEVLPEHKYLNIVGGFLSVQIKRANNIAAITFTHYSVDGEKLHTENFNELS
jgi:alkaline phosphatase D